MAGILRISEAATLALHTMVVLAVRAPARVATNEIAELLGASENTLAKVLARLGKEGILDGVTGPGGGFALAGNPEETTLLEVYEAVEGPMGEPECLLGAAVCDDTGCVLGGLVEAIHSQVCAYFNTTTVVQLAEAVSIGACS